MACALAHRPLAAVAQSRDRLPVIGVLIGLAEGDPEIPERVRAFEMGLRDLGWVQGAGDDDFRPHREQLFSEELDSIREG